MSEASDLYVVHETNDEPRIRKRSRPPAAAAANNQELPLRETDVDSSDHPASVALESAATTDASANGSSASRPLPDAIVSSTDGDGVAGDGEESPVSPVYQVGYGCPPKETQFRKGQSGNPKGRPKNAKNARTIADEILNRPTTIRRNGKSMTVPAYQVVLEQMMKKAMEGDHKAAVIITREWLQLHPEGVDRGALASAPADEPGITASERAMLAHAQRIRLQDKGFADEDISDVLSVMQLSEKPADVEAEAETQKDGE